MRGHACNSEVVIERYHMFSVAGQRQYTHLSTLIPHEDMSYLSVKVVYYGVIVLSYLRLDVNRSLMNYVILTRKPAV